MRMRIDSKVMYVASWGGHWTELEQLCNTCINEVYVSTNAKSNKFHYSVKDCNKTNYFIIFITIIKLFTIILYENPKIIISTGAAPGVLAVIIGRLLGKKTIWIDSFANTEKISLSGRVANRFSNKTYTQWKHLVKEDIGYIGSLIE